MARVLTKVTPALIDAIYNVLGKEPIAHWDQIESVEIQIKTGSSISITEKHFVLDPENA